MTSPPRFATTRRGVIVDDPFRIDIRVVQELASGRHYTTVGPSLSEESWSSEAELLAALAETPVIEWATAVAASEDEKACFVCGAGLGEPRTPPGRYPETLCPPCVIEAVDDEGRPLSFSNATMGRYVGFRAVRVDTGEESDEHRCTVRGVACWADEAYFGGIVVIPYERR
jgi:hypothetical protein